MEWKIYCEYQRQRPRNVVRRCSSIVKLQFKLNSSVQVGQGVDFVFPLSQEQEEEQEEQEQEEP